MPKQLLAGTHWQAKCPKALQLFDFASKQFEVKHFQVDHENKQPEWREAGKLEPFIYSNLLHIIVIYIYITHLYFLLDIVVTCTYIILAYLCMLYAFVLHVKSPTYCNSPHSCSKARLLRWPLWGSLAAKRGPSSTGCGASTAATENWDRRGWLRCGALRNSRKSSWCLQQDSWDKHEDTSLSH